MNGNTCNRTSARHARSWSGHLTGTGCVGASTGAPLSEHADDFAAAFCDTDVDIDRTFYFAEKACFCPDIGAKGSGHRFFDRREDFARENGFTNICFLRCGAWRPGTPNSPKPTAPLDPFWEKRGYAPLDGVIAKFAWKDVDQPYQTKKPLQFWMRKPLNTAFKHSLYTLPLKQGVRGKGAGQSGISRTAWQH